MKNPHIIIIDMQNHFLYKKNEYDFTNDAAKINQFIQSQKLKSNKLTIVVDVLDFNNKNYEVYDILQNYSDDGLLQNYIKEKENLIDLQNYSRDGYEELTEEVEKFIYQNEHILKYNLDTKLMTILDDSNISQQNLNLITKEYAYIRDVMDTNIDIAFYIGELPLHEWSGFPKNF